MVNEDHIDTVVKLIAENPGSTIDDLQELIKDLSINPVHLNDILETAKNRNLILEMNDKYWVMRTGKYSFDEYDHPV